MVSVKDLGFTVDDLLASIVQGDVRSQNHPEYPNLKIFNYCEDVQFRNRWNKVTLACRGLILDTGVEGYEVVARPWNKFFNFGQRDNEIESDAPVEVTDKLDGSLGILYVLPTGDIAIATRGSFASDQAIHATDLFKKYYYADINPTAPCENTYLFEIIYPDNRIVVDYDGMDDLVLLGSVQKQYGWYEGPSIAAATLNWPGPVAEAWHYDHFRLAVGFPDRHGKEGVVIRSGNKMVKVKQADYVELHRIVTNLSPRTIHKMIGDGKSIDDICRDIPDEFHKYVTDIGRALIEQASEIEYQAQLTFGNVLMKIGAPSWPASPIPSRKAFADEAKKRDNAGLLFSLLDGKDIRPVVWESIKPRGDIKTLVKDEG